jgi:hypothetical protein
MSESTPSPCTGLVDAFVKGWSDLTVMAPKPGGRGKQQPVAQRAYLLFNRWEDNPLAQELAEQFPKWPRDRVTVPDRYFEHREDSSPFLLELPEELVLPVTGVQTLDVREWLTQCLELTLQQVNQRILKQDFCGIVVSAASAQAIARHWVALGNQCPPFKNESVLFRYHDARVMQRVWPALSPLQQSRWLGPVTQWWSLRQPWGPFNDKPESAEWFQARTPVLPHGVVPGGSPRNLFDEAQWFLSGISPGANMIWRSYADHHIPSQAQPDPDSLVQMLADAGRLRLEGFNLEDYVWITWLHKPSEGLPRATDWSLPHLAATLSRIEDRLRDNPDARFSSLFVEITRSQR